MNREYNETFRREKSARKNFFFCTPDYFEPKVKKKSWNFFEVR